MPSEVTTYDAAAGTVPVLTVEDAPAGATGFNVYMGLSPETVSEAEC